MNKIVVATITCDFKRYSTEEVLQRNLELAVPRGWEKAVYLNVETNLGWQPARDIACDVWSWGTSTWHKRRTKDQDQAHRLSPIVAARNMARDFALSQDADALLYVDSDVVVPVDSIPRLLETGKSIVSGLVPGRGAHGHVFYTGSGQHFRKVAPNLIELDYATAGFVLIRRPVFQSIAWRWGWTQEGEGPWSEDPIFGYDARKAGFGWWYLRTDVRADHLDNPARPLSEEEAAGF
jgi:hypothetical protein